MNLPETAENKNPATKQDEDAKAALQTSMLRATVERAEQLVTGAWKLALISGELGFSVKVEGAVMPPEGFKPGDDIRLEYKKGDHPFFGPFIKAHLLNA